MSDGEIVFGDVVDDVRGVDGDSVRARLEVGVVFRR